MKNLIILIFVSLWFWGDCSLADSNNVPDPVTYIRLMKLAQTIKVKETISSRQKELSTAMRTPVRRQTREEHLDYPYYRQTGPKTYPDRKAKQEDITRIKQIIEDLNNLQARIDANDLNEILVPFRPPLAVGQIGRMHGPDTHDQRMIIQNIIDSNNCVVTFRLGFGSRTDISQAVWIKGISTINLADDSILKLPPFMRITCTTNYFNPIGVKNTLFVLEPFNPPESF